MMKYKNVDKQLEQINHNEEQLLKNIVSDQEKQNQANKIKIEEQKKKEEEEAKKLADKMRWKQKFVKLWQEGDKYD